MLQQYYSRPKWTFRGVHFPWGNDAFPSCFKFPPISEKFLRLRRKFSQFDLFRNNFPIFIRKISDDLFFLLVIDYNFVMSSPVFALSVHFPLFRKNVHFPPTFANFPPDFVKFVFFTYFLWLSFSPTLTMMHLCITQCMYWTPLWILVNGITYSGY